MAKTPEEMLASMLANLEAKTGKSLEEWVEIARGTGLGKHGQLVSALKKDHGLTHGYANLIAQKSLGGSSMDAAPDDLVAGQYSGKKEGLRPIYDFLIEQVLAFGDVDPSPKKAYVSLRRNKQFGLVQPSTATRVDVGLNLKGKDPSDRLEMSGSFNSMCTHRVRLTSVSDVDDELVGWLREAWEKA